MHEPLARLAFHCEALGVESSLRAAADSIRHYGSPVVPVHQNGHILGVVTQASLAHALAVGLDPEAPLSSVALEQIPMLYASASGSEALRVFSEQRISALLVVDGGLSLVGIVTPAQLYPHAVRAQRPRMVGGMATPFGVYLTTGAQSGGVNRWALAATGALLFALVLVAQLVTDGLGNWSAARGVRSDVLMMVLPPLSTLFFLGLLRISPVAGYHAAEHMVVHAIERGENLVPEVVSRMPRVHPRCGTNIAVGASLFLGISGWTVIPDPELRLVLAVLVTMTIWRPLGSLVQYYATTRPPNQKQLAAGIKAGEQLLSRYQRAPVLAPNGWVRFYNSGILQIMGGSLGCALVLELVTWLFKLPRIIELV